MRVRCLISSLKDFMIRWINITLALLAVCGHIIAFRESSVNTKLLDEYRTLAAETGYLDVLDAGKVHVVALPTEDPLHFRWRIYLPEKRTVFWQTSHWSDSGSSSTGPIDFVAQVRIRTDEDGLVRVFTDLGAHSSVVSLGGRELCDFMRDRWDTIEISQLGLNGLAAVEPENGSTLLRLQLPKEIASEAEAILPSSWAKQVIPVLYQVQFGPTEGWQYPESAESENGKADR